LAGNLAARTRKRKASVYRLLSYPRTQHGVMRPGAMLGVIRVRHLRCIADALHLGRDMKAPSAARNYFAAEPWREAITTPASTSK
jgi:hypothetical protein